ncbi:MAG TPA: helix-turn-helix domain-containing protein [Acidisarcina sp.]
MRTSAALKPTPAPQSALALKAAPKPAPQAAHQMVREVMDIRQASDYLGISSDTLYKYASEGGVPAFKLGNRWRFKKSRLDEWMDQQSDASMTHPEATPVSPRQKKPVRAAR